MLVASSGADELGAKESGSRPSIHSATILVVDDDAQVQATLARILERYGHSCSLSSAAEDAMHVLAESRPDVVLCDVGLPGESGIQLLEHVRRDFPHLPVVMISGIGEIDVATTALELGAYGWVSKPFDATQVLIAVANALIRARLEEESEAYKRELEDAVQERTAKLEDTVKRLEGSERELRRITEDTISALMRAIERRDLETGDHIERVSRYAEMLARHCGLAEEHCEMIRAAAPMHDVGKIGIPDGILLKPGAVTRAEFDVIKQHVALGHMILSRSAQPLLLLAAEIAQTHHERWDGKGYLRRLKGEQIPLGGRITAIADTFDALVSRRVYKQAVPLEQAFTIIRENRGTQFDPHLTDLFLEHREEATDIFVSTSMAETGAGPRPLASRVK